MYNVGDLILIRYGNGTQAARVRAETRTGSLRVDRFYPTYKRDAGAWRSPTGTVKADHVIGVLPADDARRFMRGFVTATTAVVAS